MLYYIHFRQIANYKQETISCLGCNADMFDSSLCYLEYLLNKLNKKSQSIRRALSK